MKTRFLLLLCGVMCAASVSAQGPWNIGSPIAANVTATLSDSVLTISGTGAMANYSSSSNAPWYSNRTSIASVVIGEGVTSIGHYAFYDYPRITSFTIPNSVISLGNYAFVGCVQLTSISIPNSVTSIGNYAFNQCTRLSSITIPNSVTSIGSAAFQQCSRLTSASISNSVTSISSDMFRQCPMLTSITIPNSVTSISNYAFYDCTGLTSVTLGNSVTSISTTVFANCRGLTSITIPGSVTSIGNNAFQGCTGLTSVTFKGGSAIAIGSDIFVGCSAMRSIACLSATPPVVSGAGFESLSNIASICLEVPQGATTAYRAAAGWSAFDCIGEQGSHMVTFDAQGGVPIAPQTVPAGGKAVQPADPTHGSYTFGGWYSDAGLNTPWNFGANVVNDHITLYAKWSGCSSFTAYGASITIGWSLCNGTLTISGEGDMPNYRSVALPPWHSYRTSITSVAIDSRITSIGNYAFYNCQSNGLACGNINFITSVTIPSSVTSIGNNAFQSCVGLTSVTIPKSVTSIGTSAFQGCTGLTSVTISEGVTSISNNAFSGCSGLTSITIPSIVTSIGNNAFSQCSGLTEITIPSSVTTIGTSVFIGCTSLTSITSRRLTPPSAQSNSFSSVNASCCLYVQATALTDYTTATGWSSIPCIQALPGTYYTATFDTQGGNSIPAQQVEQGSTAQEPASPTRAGYVFVGWYRNAQGTLPWSFTSTVTGNLTLYAKWVQVYTVTFNAQNGTPTPVAQQLEPGHLAQLPTAPTRSGHVFGGWYMEAHCTTPWNFNTVVAYDLTLYARWLPVFFVTFEPQGGSAVPPQQLPQGSTAAAPASAPTRASYVFAGWFKEPECVTAWSFASDVVKGNVTLYAKWINSAVTIRTVTFNSQGGSAVEAQQVQKNFYAAQPGAPVRAGFTFGGWYTEPACTTKWSFGSTAVTSNVTLYALWLCTVTFNANGGSGVPRQVVRVGSKLTLPANPRHKNYNFTMWYSDLCLATPWDFENGTVAGDMMMYAGWAPK